MSDDPFDVIVIGAGLAGLCCAGELVLQGKRPLLIAESAEVGVALRAHQIAGNTGIMQAPTVMVGWGGGWWLNLVRRLNAPVRLPTGFAPLSYDLALEGMPELIHLPLVATSPSDLIAVFCELFPPVRSAADDLERLFQETMAMPHTELAKLHDVPLVQWLEDRKLGDEIIHLLMVLASGINASACSLQYSKDTSSVYGFFGGFRAIFCGEALFAYPYPDPRNGLAIPLAKAIEKHGGAVWRGRKVARVTTDNGRVGTVALADGTEVRAPDVVVATGNSRIRSLFNPLPPELVAPLDYSDEVLAHKDFHVTAVIDKSVLPILGPHWIAVLDPGGNGMLQWMGFPHLHSPWSVQPGKQLVLSATAIPVKELGPDPDISSIYSTLHDRTEVYYPGYRNAIEVAEETTHAPGHLWFGSVFIGPKVPRTVESVAGLWFVGECNAPTDMSGMWMDAAASAGILGARAIAGRRSGT